VRQEAYYRCRHHAQYAIATTLRHLKAVNLREADLLPTSTGGALASSTPITSTP